MLRGALLALVWWLTGVQALPPVGYVDLDALAAGQQRAERPAALRRQAAELRARAAGTGLAEVPPPPRTEVPGAEGRLAQGTTEFERKADDLELQLLRKALLDQVGRSRQRELSIRAREVNQQLIAAEERSAQLQRDWERSLALAQRYERINLQVQLDLPGLQAAETDRLERELNALESATEAVARERLQERGRAATRRSRQQVAALERQLEEEALALERQGERLLAQREFELAEENLRRRQYRLAQLERLGELRVDLDLADWRTALADRVDEVAYRTGQQRRELLAAAARLDEEAARLDAELAAGLRAQALAWLRHLQRRENVVFRFEPAAGVPDVTAEVAATIAALAAAPATLAPPQEVLLP